MRESSFLRDVVRVFELEPRHIRSAIVAPCERHAAATATKAIVQEISLYDRTGIFLNVTQRERENRIELLLPLSMSIVTRYVSRMNTIPASIVLLILP